MLDFSIDSQIYQKHVLPYSNQAGPLTLSRIIFASCRSKSVPKKGMLVEDSAGDALRISLSKRIERFRCAPMF
jgi:hypothetical protein